LSPLCFPPIQRHQLQDGTKPVLVRVGMGLLALSDKLRQLTTGAGLLEVHYRQFLQLLYLRKAEFTYANGIVSRHHRDLVKLFLSISGPFTLILKKSFQSSQTFQSTFTAFFVLK
jgi:hypothetical protein